MTQAETENGSWGTFGDTPAGRAARAAVHQGKRSVAGSGQCVILTGPWGSGRSAVLREVSRQLASTHRIVRLGDATAQDVPAWRGGDLDSLDREWRRLRRLADRHPLLVIVDDLERAGEDVRALVAHLAVRVHDSRMLVVASMPGHLQVPREARTMRLRWWTEAELRVHGAWEPEAAAALLAATGGVPLLVSQAWLDPTRGWQVPDELVWRAERLIAEARAVDESIVSTLALSGGTLSPGALADAITSSTAQARRRLAHPAVEAVIRSGDAEIRFVADVVRHAAELAFAGSVDWAAAAPIAASMARHGAVDRATGLVDRVGARQADIADVPALAELSRTLDQAGAHRSVGVLAGVVDNVMQRSDDVSVKEVGVDVWMAAARGAQARQEHRGAVSALRTAAELAAVARQWSDFSSSVAALHGLDETADVETPDACPRSVRVELAASRMRRASLRDEPATAEMLAPFAGGRTDAERALAHDVELWSRASHCDELSVSTEFRDLAAAAGRDDLYWSFYRWSIASGLQRGDLTAATAALSAGRLVARRVGSAAMHEADRWQRALHRLRHGVAGDGTDDVPVSIEDDQTRHVPGFVTTAARAHRLAAAGDVRAASVLLRRRTNATGIYADVVRWLWADVACVVGAPGAATELLDEFAAAGNRRFLVSVVGPVTFAGHPRHILGRLALVVGDTARGVAELDAVTEIYRHAGLRSWQRAAERCRARTPTATVRTDRVQEPTRASVDQDEREVHLEFVGSGWRLRSATGESHLPRRRGLDQLATLVARPGVFVPATTLAGSGSDGDRDSPSVDGVALESYRTRLVDLAQELEEARSWNDLERVASLEDEVDAIERELRRSTGLGGRARRSGPAERARLNVTRNLRHAIDLVAERDRSVGEHLTTTVRTGRHCVYAEDPSVAWRWEVSRGSLRR